MAAFLGWLGANGPWSYLIVVAAAAVLAILAWRVKGPSGKFLAAVIVVAAIYFLVIAPGGAGIAVGGRPLVSINTAGPLTITVLPTVPPQARVEGGEAAMRWALIDDDTTRLLPKLPDPAAIPLPTGLVTEMVVITHTSGLTQTVTGLTTATGAVDAGAIFELVRDQAEAGLVVATELQNRSDAEINNRPLAIATLASFTAQLTYRQQRAGVAAPGELTALQAASQTLLRSVRYTASPRLYVEPPSAEEFGADVQSLLSAFALGDAAYLTLANTAGGMSDADVNAAITEEVQKLGVLMASASNLNFQVTDAGGNLRPEYAGQADAYKTLTVILAETQGLMTDFSANYR